MPNQKAFTLIELLIVVAIIAILAAIAVPNFVQAQVRSKVSHALVEMTTLRTGLEAYAVDYGVYPPNQSMDPGTPGMPPFDEKRSLQALSTPLAYLQNAHLTDIFPNQARPETNREWVYTFMSLGSNTPLVRDFYGGLLNLPDAELAQIASYQYVIMSVGPDEINEVNRIYLETGDLFQAMARAFQDSVNGAAEYDPTNGVISGGDIVLFGSGFRGKS